MEPECKCQYDDKTYPYMYCPKCGSFLANIFIGEKFLSKNEETPLRKLIKHLIYDRRGVVAKGKIKSPLTSSGAQLWEKIQGPINDSQICIYDISKRRFNVGYELGYAISQKKLIFICSDIAKRKPDWFSQWSFIGSPPINKKYINLIDFMITLNNMNLPKSENEKMMKYYADENTIKNLSIICDDIENAFYVIDYESSLDRLYQETDSYVGDKFPNEKKVLLLLLQKNLKRNLNQLCSLIT